MANNHIDWQPICDSYNARQSTRHSVAEMIEHLYRNVGSIQRIANYLGVDYVTLARKMDSLGLTRRKYQARPGTIRWHLDRLPDKKFSRMTNHELALYADCSLNEIYKYKATAKRTCINEPRCPLDVSLARRKKRRANKAKRIANKI